MTIVDRASPSIRNVSDTALWVAVYRAIESDRDDALFRDPFARRLAGERGQAIVDALPFGQAMGWSIVVRTAVMDAIILRCIDRGARTVLNLGAGLDARAFRLKLPPTLRWLDVDLPAVTAYRREGLGAAVAVCRHAHVESDLRHADERHRVIRDAARHGPLLVITEGLLVYLAPEQVSELAAQLRNQANSRWWLADLITPPLQQTMGMVWSAQLDAADAAFRFAPGDSRKYFDDLNWRETEFHSTWTESIRLDRVAPNGWMWDRLLQWSSPAAKIAMTRMSGVVLLEPTSRVHVA
ncbi:SAM-dependent methyltransferase [Ideonella sp. A 288]|uniref:class I SAM-dependent methyltransferase n=1 Tax=Ideonella sp. A 288 TaxID=1962181 RepID=UPI00130342FC|nr:SAM-dependent methyltransferase [Ideonella sp. A 288]